MRVVLFVFFISTLFFSTANAQVKFGIKTGISTIDLQPKDLSISNQNNDTQLGLALVKANYGVHFGAFTQIQFKKFIIQPEVLFNSNKFEYQLEDFADSDTYNQLFSETYRHLDIPILFGYKGNFLRLQAGPVGHLFLNNSSELTDVAAYNEHFKKMTYGWQANLGIDIWKFMLDFRYEGNFNKFGDHFNFFGQQYNFDDRAGRFMASIGFVF